MKTEQEKKLDNLRTTIRRILKKAGGYDPSLSYQIELVASDVLIYRRLRDELLNCVDLTTLETSREGYPRMKVNPLVFEVREQSKAVQKGLDLLTMNIKSKKGKSEARDTLSEFMARMDEE